MVELWERVIGHLWQESNTSENKDGFIPGRSNTEVVFLLSQPAEKFKRERFTYGFINFGMLQGSQFSRH